VIRFVLVALLFAGSAIAQRRGGTIRLLARNAAGTIDPQVNYTAQYWQLFCFLYDGLVAFRKVPGRAGLELVPDLAQALPAAEQGGLVYRFRLRKGIRFSDGRAVRPADVVASFRRIFAVRSPTAGTFYGAIEGASECLARPRGCTLPGVSVEGDEIVFRLSRPEPEFLTRLALPHASIVPADAPQEDAGTRALPATGPYRIAFYDPDEALRIERNPYFRQWSAEAQPEGVPDRIEYEFGLEDEAEVTAIENGQADWMFDTPPEDRLGELGGHFLDEVHLNPALAIWFVPLNTHIAPFDDLRVRRAFNMAVDRGAVVKLFGGRKLAAPSCQVLPPGLPGYVAYCPYPRALEQARRLVEEAGDVDRPVTLITDDSPVARTIGIYLRDVLADLGLRAKLRSLSGDVEFPYIQNSDNRVQASLTSWYADYPSAGNFLLGVFGCAAFHPGSDSSPNIAGFCDPALDARVADGIARGDLAELAAVDRAITNAAPSVVLFNPQYVDVVSRRIDGYAYHEVFRWLIDRASLP
jgi:peptide/nickel transport system substrate-binding protein